MRINRLILALIFTCIFGKSFAGTVHSIPIAIGKPIVHRNAEGNYGGCGLRVVSTLDVPAPNHFLDFSVSVIKNEENLAFGIIEIFFAKKTKASEKPTYYKLKNFRIFPESAIVTIKPSSARPSFTNKNALMATTTPSDAYDLISILLANAPVHVEVHLPNEDGFRTFRLAVQSIEEDDDKTLSACLKGL